MRWLAAAQRLPMPTRAWWAACALLLAGASTARAQPRPGDEAMPPEIASSDAADAAMGQRLQAALRRHGADIYGCYDQALAAQPGLAGEVLVRLFVAPGGDVRRADVLKDDAGSPRLAECLRARLIAWKVPELAGLETSQVVFPLVFKPEEAHPVAGASAPAGQPAGGEAPAALPLRFVVPLSEGKPGPLGARARVEARVLVDPLTVGPTRGSLTQLVLAPTARLAPHKHPGVLEVLYVVKGLARVRGLKKGELLVANTGDVIVIPPSGVHSIESAPLASLTLLQFFAPGGPEHAYRDPADRRGTVAAVAPGGPACPEEVQAIELKQRQAGVTDPGELACAVYTRTLDRETDMPVVVKAGDPPALPIAAGRGKAWLYLDNLPVGQAAVQRLEAEAGAEVPLHVHDKADEILFILAGRGQMTVGGEAIPVGPNDAVHLPMAVPHALRVSERLVAIQCYAPGGPEQRFKKPPAAR